MKKNFLRQKSAGSDFFTKNLRKWITKKKKKKKTHIMSNAVDFDMTHHEHFQLHPFGLLYQMQF